MSEPRITHRAAHDSGGGNKPVHRIVIHATCPPHVPYPKASASGQALSTARYFQEKGSGGSAHYVVDAGGHEEHCVPDSVVAWHAPPNTHSIGIEIAGQATYTRAQWLSDQVWPAVQLAAKRTAELCRRLGVPVRRITVAQLRAGAEGICGHVDVSQAFHASDHSDPGPHFPWDEFMAAVAGLDLPTTPQHADTWTEKLVKDLPTLKRGELDEDDQRRWDVKTVFYLLHARGYGIPGTSDDTVFGEVVDNAVRAFQRAEGIDVDGIVGPDTWAHLLRLA